VKLPWEHVKLPWDYLFLVSDKPGIPNLDTNLKISHL